MVLCKLHLYSHLYHIGIAAGGLASAVNHLHGPLFYFLFFSPQY